MQRYVRPGVVTEAVLEEVKVERLEGRGPGH